MGRARVADAASLEPVEDADRVRQRYLNHPLVGGAARAAMDADLAAIGESLEHLPYGDCVEPGGLAELGPGHRRVDLLEHGDDDVE